MRNFLLGCITALAAVLLAAFCFIRFGLVDPRADIPVGRLETKLAMPALDAAVDRRAPQLKNPIAATDANLIAGMKLYQTGCAGCHGDIHQPHSAFGDGFYPRAPQFVEDAPDMPENENYYILQHGIRLSGMPAWQTTYNPEQLWQITGFLSHMDKLPPAVSDAWKTAAAGNANQSH